VDNGNLIGNTGTVHGASGSHLKGRSRLRLLCICFCGALALGGCTLPQAPGRLQWDTHLTVPLGVRTYGLTQLVDTALATRQTGSGIGMDSDSILYFASFQNLKVPVDDSLFIAANDWVITKPAYMTDTTGHFELPRQRHRLLRAFIAQGSMAITVRSTSPGVSDSITVTVANMTSSSGDTLRLRRWASDVATTDTMSLRGYFLNLDDENPQTAILRMHSDIPMGAVALLHTTQLYFSYYTGILDSLDVPAEPSRTHIEHLPSGWNSVHPTAVQVLTHIRQGIHGAVADITADVHTFLDSSPVPIDSASLSASHVDLSADTTLVFNGLDHMINPYPDEAEASGTLILSGAITSHGHDTILVNVELHAPLSFTLDSLHAPDSVIKVQTEDLGNIRGGSARIRIWNRLPLGGRAFLVADHDSADVLAGSGAWVDTVANVSIPVAPLTNGRALTPIYTEFTVTLSDSMIAMLKHPPFYTRTEVDLPASGDTLLAHAADWVKVQIIADLTYHMDTEGGN
jgi:hypothetical protein